MNERDLAARLNSTELACLRYLLSYPEAELYQFDWRTVDRLLEWGLIDRVLLMALPILPRQVRYRLTEKGRDVLKAVSR